MNPSSSFWSSVVPLLAVNGFFAISCLIFRSIFKKRGETKEVADRHSSKLVNKWFREYWLWITDPVVKFFVKFRVSPNTITVLGVLFAVVSTCFFATGQLGLGGWLMIAGATFDIFDGRVARITNRETKSGAYFDGVLDRISEGLVFLGLAVHYRNHWALYVIILCLLGSFMVSYTRAKGEAAGIHFEGGVMQRPERIVYLGVGAIFAPLVGYVLSIPLGWDPTYLVYLIPVTFVAVMTWWTSFERISNVMKRLDAK